TVGSSVPGTVTETPAQAIAVETAPVIANRIRNSMNGSGSLLPAHSTLFSSLSVRPVFCGVLAWLMGFPSCRGDGDGTADGRRPGRRVSGGWAAAAGVRPTGQSK